ncbi:MAG: transcriptional regulator [Acidimicrobiales bacterium]
MREDELERSYAVKVGSRLRAVRRQKRLSLQAVEEASDQEFKASVLGAYERGERTISVPRLQRLAELYDVPVDQLLPRDSGPGSVVALGEGAEGQDDLGPARHWDDGGKVTIDLTKLGKVTGPERDLLRRYLGMIQVQRQDFNGRMITIRTEDLRAIACLFEMTAEEMGRRLDDLGLRLRV